MRRKLIDLCAARSKEIEKAEAALNANDQETYAACMVNIGSMNTEVENIQALIREQERTAVPSPTNVPTDNLVKAESEARAFENYIRTGSLSGGPQNANMTVGDNGAIIPSTVAQKIIEMIFELSPLAKMASRYEIGGNLTIPVYDDTSDKISMTYADEFTALTSSAGKFSSVTLTGYLAGALAKISRSLINNNDFDLVPFVERKIAEVAAQWLEGQMLNGTASKIDGISKQAASVTAKSATSVTADELIDLQESVPDRYQPNCFWVMSKKTRAAIRKLKNSEGDYLLNRDFTAPWSYTLLGRPVYVSDNMPDMAASKRAIAYLDPTGVAMKISEKPTAQVLLEKYADEHAVGVICWIEADSKIENKQKVAVLEMGVGG